MFQKQRHPSPSTTQPVAAFVLALVVCLAFVLSLGDVDQRGPDPGSVRPMSAPAGLDQ